MNIADIFKKHSSDADLRGADLRGADLHDANLRDADLYGADLRNANLHGANLHGANLRDADLRGADLHDANLRDADLRNADLYGADLRYADLHDANLRDADLYGADLRNANLHGANLHGANLRGADLRNADLYGADLRNANLDKTISNIYTSFYPLQCPESGSFCGFKKAGGKIVTLQICEDAKRSSATSRKCRCSKAIVLDITNIDGSVSGLNQISSDHNSSFVYKIGELVEVKNFDEDRWNECASGIHFFITREEAVNY